MSRKPGLHIIAAGLVAGTCAGGALPARAHPHVFIDAGLTLIADAQGRITNVEVTWRYDELYSLLVLQDYGLDQDFDNALTEAEVAANLGFDLNWNSGFEGGLVLRRGDVPLVIGPPEPVSLTLRDDGRLETVHRRPVLGDAGTDRPVIAQIYDEAFFIAFDVTLPSGVEGVPGCTPDLVRADLDAAYAALEAEIARLGGLVAAEVDFPAVGGLFADKLVFSCVRSF